MHKIILISLSTPTFNNIRAASALPYHLIKGYAGEGKFEVYSYNINDIDSQGIEKAEKELDVKIHLLKRPWWMAWMFKLHMGVLRILLKHPYLSYLGLPQGIVREISDSRPDLIWFYGEELAGLARLFKGTKTVVTMPDCESMFYYRMLKLNWNTDSIAKTLKYAFAYWQYRNMEKAFFTPGVAYHFVGKEDADFYRSINPGADASFLPHPLYAYDEARTIAFHRPKVRLLFAGRYDYYCSHGTDELLQAFVRHCDKLKEHYEITFLGKGWSRWNAGLQKSGFTSRHVGFAPNYIEELQKHDIQINAIDVGTGTKGKVLDALSNGLLAFGTPLALENIGVRHGESCIMYQHAEEAIAHLLHLPEDVSRFEQIAFRGRQEVIRLHGSKTVAEALFRMGGESCG